MSSQNGDALCRQYEHIFLPPDAGQGGDFGQAGFNDGDMIRNLLESLREFKYIVDDPAAPAVQTCIRSVEHILSTRPTMENLDRPATMEAMKSMRIGDVLTFHVTKQNAGVVVTRTESNMTFEAFELLASNETVMTCKGSLVRQFPTTSTLIPKQVWSNPDFIEAFSEGLCSLDANQRPEFVPETKKQGKHVAEERDTISPVLVTEMIPSWLRGLGSTVSKETAQIRKRSREQVNFNHGNRLAWHRSALWLFLRVALRLIFDRADLSTNQKPSTYKLFMIYHMARILGQGRREDMVMEKLYIMNAKVSRRIMKLGDFQSDNVVQFVQTQVSECRKHLLVTWTGVQAAGSTSLEPVPPNDILRQTRLTMRGLKSHISQAKSCALKAPKWPLAKEVTGTAILNPTELPVIPSKSKYKDGSASCITGLLQLEMWIAKYLANWVKAILEDESVDKETMTCQIAHKMRHYHKSAMEEYADNPEAMSAAFLSLLELWVACDRILIHSCPLMKRYGTGIPTSALRKLLLPEHSQLLRLKTIRGYLEQRNDSEISSTPISDNFGYAKSFAVQYFEEHDYLNEKLFEAIDKQKEGQRQMKEKWKAQRDAYVRSKAQHEESTHSKDCSTLKNIAQTRTASNKCAKCDAARVVQTSSIEVWEDFLPECLYEQKALIAELHMPPSVHAWRNATLDLIRNMFPSAETPDQRRGRLYWLEDHNKDITPPKNSSSIKPRIQLASRTKSFTDAHYKTVLMSLATTVDKVCVPLGYKYSYFDHFSFISLSTSVKESDGLQNCSFAALSGHSGDPPKFLARCIEETTHTSNTVVAHQPSRPADMSASEFQAFGHLRAGIHLQWRNILTQLASPSLDLGSVQTSLLLAQIAWEVGPPYKTEYLVSHWILRVEPFGQALLETLQSIMDRTSSKRESANSLFVVLILILRLGDLTTSQSVKASAASLLKQLRHITFALATQLFESTRENHSLTDADGVGETALTFALICHGTFSPFKRAWSSADAQILVSVMALRFAASRFADQSKSPLMTILMHMSRRFSVETRAILRAAIMQPGNECLERVVSDRFGPGLRRHGGWMNSPSSSLVRATFIWQEKFERKITFDLFTGALLVDGQEPSCGLTEAYHSHADFRSLFGECDSTKFVISGRSGMHYTSSSKYRGWEVHLALVDGSLAVHAIQGDKVYEYIPPHVLGNELPSILTHNYCHWLNLSTGNVEFRPIETLWELTSDIWTLDLRSQNLSRGSEVVINQQSTMVEALVRVLGPLETPEHVFCVLTGQKVLVELPRRQLSFVYDPISSDLSSKNYAGMILDPNQTIGTLIGLQSLLVLTRRDGGAMAQRIVLTPLSIPSPDSRTKHHVSVRLTPISIAKHRSNARGGRVVLGSLKHCVYRIDGHLQRLEDSGLLRDKLHLAHLHALTSSCLPDPLTGHTGTEEALRILGSAAVKSFAALGFEEVTTLKKIAALAPGRAYYPEHLKRQEEIEWPQLLPVLSMDDSLRKAVNAIFAHERDVCILHSSEKPETGMLNEAHEFLSERAAARNAFVRVSGFGAESPTENGDRRYKQRHLNTLDEKRRRSSGITELLGRETSGLIERFPMLKESCQRLLTSTIKGLSSGVQRPRTLTVDVETRFEDTIGEEWCQIHEFLSSCTNIAKEKFRLSLIFSIQLFSSPNQDLWPAIQVLSTFATTPGMRAVRLGGTTLMSSSSLEMELISSMNQRYITPKAGKGLGSKQPTSPNDGVDLVHRGRLAAEFMSGLLAQWPCEKPQLPGIHGLAAYVDDFPRLLDDINSVFQAEAHRVFNEYLDGVMTLVKKLPVVRHRHAQGISSETDSLTILLTENHGQAFMDLSTLFLREAPELPVPPTLPIDIAGPGIQDPKGLERRVPQSHTINDLFQGLLVLSTTAHELEYIEQLRRSNEADNLFKHGSDAPEDWVRRMRPKIEKHRDACFEVFGTCQRLILDRLGPTTVSQAPAELCGHWPRISTTVLLQQLSIDRWGSHSKGWQRAFVAHALTLAALQRAERLGAALSTSWADFKNELTNTGHANWNPFENPESLLMEVENNFLIRPQQSQIASLMISPPDNHNAVMQLNMGEGKSSVIVPVIAATLADRSKLVRVIVCKAQFKQMSHVLVRKLGGLLNRRIWFLPIRRSSPFSPARAQYLLRILENCAKQGGILLVQPEHILSFKLMIIECNLAGDMRLAETMIQALDYMDTHVRDIVDESDAVFDAKFELVYTMGKQQPVDFHGDRWTLIQILLGRLWTLCEQEHESDPRGVELLRSTQHAMPIIRILEPSTTTKLMEMLADSICNFGLDGLALHHRPLAFRRSLKRYLLEAEYDKDSADVREVEDNFATGSPVHQDIRKLWILRGLIGGGILTMALCQKRWRVNYGRSQSHVPPTPLAVPYVAKDCPSPRSEFSHPDVVIVLTCLTYYYQGLTNKELHAALGCLGKHNQEEFATWIRHSKEAQNEFQDISSIDLKDRRLCETKLFPRIRDRKPVIDFYLSRLVFPRYLKEFPQKLSASGWDLARQTDRPMTGFSGTCDSKHLLPLPVTHLELEEQRHTNSHVLCCLLRPENRVKKIEPRQGENFSSLLIRSVVASSDPHQVILDVGAQVLELDNRQAASAWLKATTHSKFEAAIYFDDQEELSVVSRAGKTERLMSSSYLGQPQKCLVFLDEAHTRGTDLVLPDYYRAAVTLGPRLSKDRLVQACMRMRKLGRGQSVTFLVHPEIQHSISQLRNLAPDATLSVVDVLVWAISETWADVRRSIPLWASRGLRHQRQQIAWDQSAAARRTEDGDGAAELAAFVEKDAMTIKERYAPSQPGQLSPCLGLQEMDERGLTAREKEVLKIRHICLEHGITASETFSVQEDQERELSPELQAEQQQEQQQQQERQIERPKRATGCAHSLRKDVITFVQTGLIPDQEQASRENRTPGIFSASCVFNRFTGCPSVRNRGLFPHLWVTIDFASTVQATEEKNMISSEYLRPVNWVAISTTAPQPTMVILSPWEVNDLHSKGLIETSNSVTLHQYAPRMSLLQRSLDDLTLYTSPPLPPGWSAPALLVVQLNIFAGQLWLRSYEQYLGVCRFLGLSWGADGDHDIETDGFEGKTERNPDCRFETSPLTAVAEVLRARAGGLNVAKTDMGRILAGEVLRKEDFEGRTM